MIIKNVIFAQLKIQFEFAHVLMLSVLKNTSILIRHSIFKVSKIGRQARLKLLLNMGF